MTVMTPSTTKPSAPSNSHERYQRAMLLGLLLARNGASFQPQHQQQHQQPLARKEISTTHFGNQANVFQSRPREDGAITHGKQRHRPSIALSMSTASTDLRELERTIVGLGRKGQTDQALALYHNVEQPTVRLMNGAIDACARARPTRLNEAYEIMRSGVETLRLKPNVFTFGSLMSACSRARRPDRALQLLKSMEDKYGIEPNAIVYSSAISACARAKPPQPEKALQLLKIAVEEKELIMSVVGFNAALSACAQAGDWQNAISILTRMELAASKHETELQTRVPKPDMITYGTVLSACERAEEWPLILKYAKHMKDRGLSLDGLAITSCLHACQQLGLAQDAIDYLEEMKTTTETERMTAGLMRSGAKQPLRGADAVAYRLAISACARGGAWEEGTRLLDEFEQTTGTAADVIAYTAAITGCEYAGKWKQSFLLLDRMRKRGVEPNEWTMAAIIGACAAACAKENKPDQMLAPQQKAFRLLNVLKKDPTVVKPNIQVYNAAIRVCAEACDLEGAMDLLDEIKQVGLERTAFTYGTLMTACERVGDVEAASRVFRLMRDDDIAPNEIIYGAAISCCRKAKQSERTLMLLRKMIREELSPNVATFNTVMVAQTEGRKRADLERAILVFKLMKSGYVKESSRPNRQTYTLLILAFAASKEASMADSFLKRMRDDGFIPDVDLYTATVTAYERSGQPLKALRLMESMREDGHDFYGVKVLDSAFKKAVKLANVVGRGLSSSEKSKLDKQQLLLDDNGSDDELLMEA